MFYSADLDGTVEIELQYRQDGTVITTLQCRLNRYVKYRA